MNTRVDSPVAPATGRAVERSSPAMPPVAGPVIVATDASESAIPAFTAARLLAHRSGAQVHVVTVVEPSVTYYPPSCSVELPLDVDARRMQEQADRARDQLEELVGADPRWPIHTRYGEPASAIPRQARTENAELVIVGSSPHGLVDRLLGGDTAGQIVHRSPAPVLAARALDRLPRTVVIAASPESAPVPTSAVITTLLSEATSVHFASVRPVPPELPDFDPVIWEQTYIADVTSACDRIRRSLDLPASVFREPVVLAGNAARELAAFATRVKADLIIVGQRGGGVFDRLTGGGLAGRLLRGAPCSVLVLPRARQRQAGTGRAAHVARSESLTSSSAWTPRLGELSRANVGRRVTLEIDDVELGAQVQASDYPLLGLDYDRRDDRVEIMLGSRPGGGHIVHTVAGPTSVDVLEGAHGKTAAVRVATAGGQALLTFMT